MASFPAACDAARYFSSFHPATQAGRLRRMWNFHLTSCASAFEGGNCEVTQITIARHAG